VTSATVFTILCLASTALLLLAERFDWPATRAASKLSASAAFVLVAIALDAPASPYGRMILTALALSFAGDALLLSSRPAHFLAGLASFLAAHVSFAIAFLSGGFSGFAAAIAAIPAIAVGVAVLKWLWPHLTKQFKGPVAAYLVAILVMTVAAAGYAAASGRWSVLVGAVLFAASDISVARDRFIADGFMNKAWGLPTYFVAQLILAWSVGA
jgi:uncharacterized membrane protein YhhN